MVKLLEGAPAFQPLVLVVKRNFCALLLCIKRGPTLWCQFCSLYLAVTQNSSFKRMFPKWHHREALGTSGSSLMGVLRSFTACPQRGPWFPSSLHFVFCFKTLSQAINWATFSLPCVILLWRPSKPRNNESVRSLTATFQIMS